ncbi:uncharacterized protein LOC144209279 [Stigmatopora nigra]
MSRQKSPSPQNRRIPWNEFGPYRPKPGPDSTTQDWKHNSRDDQRGFGEDALSEGQRRPSTHNNDWRQCDREGASRRRPSPQRDASNHRAPRGSPHRDGGFDGAGARKGFRQDFQSFNSRTRQPNSPLRFPREELPLSPREVRGRDGDRWGRGRSRDASPVVGYGEEKGSRRERNPTGPDRSRHREDVQPRDDVRSLLKSSRRETDAHRHSGFRRDGKDYGEPRFSTPDGNGGSPRPFERAKAMAEDRKGPPPLLRERDNGEVRGGPESRRRTEHFWTAENRRDSREDSGKRRFPEHWGDDPERKRTPPPREPPDGGRLERRDGGPRAKGGPPTTGGGVERHGIFAKNRSDFQPAPRGYSNAAREAPSTAYGSQRESRYGEETRWRDGNRRVERVGSAATDGRQSPQTDGTRRRSWEEPKLENMMVVAKEKLTIKVDRSRPIRNASSPCYSAVRQLSVDLVNAGRRPDLPPPPTSGSHAEGSAAVFAQEIITLVHAVKGLYFKGQDLTLDRRFSELTPGGRSPEEGAALTLDQRFSSQRTLADSTANKIPSLLELTHGPGDLRHDLERRRQKRLEGVTVTIVASGPADAQRVSGVFRDKRDYYRDGNTDPRRGGGGGPIRMSRNPGQRFKASSSGRTSKRYAAAADNNDKHAGPSW